MIWRIFISTLCFLGLTHGTFSLDAQSNEKVDFTQSIKPILADNCFACHGPDQQKAGLRLDDPETSKALLKSGERAIVPHQSDASAMVDRIFSEDPDEIMPPPEKEGTLSTKEKSLLKAWISQGAPYEKHWAYVPPKRPTQPEVRLKSWPKNPIDFHTLAKMEENELLPSLEANPYVLLRRVYLDLKGLPPTPEQIESFIQDPNPNRYERVVEDLLQSPRYGERWARRWLDLARYADTNGYEKDRYRSIWPYREWVIHALNEGMPFDEFSIKQIAGDMLPDATESDRIATGFHRNTMINEEGGIDVEEFRFEAVVDRVKTTGTTWMGLAIGCAQCHGHKFDPISHTEYWQLFAIFNNADEPEMNIYDRQVADQRDEINQQIQQLKSSLKTRFPNQPADLSDTAGTQYAKGEYYQERLNQWLDEARQRSVKWHALKPENIQSKLHATMTRLPDDSVLASGDKPNRDIYTIDFKINLEEISGFRLEALAHPSLPQGGPGRAHFFQTGDFLLSEFIVESLDEKGEWIKHSLKEATDSHHKKGHEAEKSMDGLLDTGWQIGNRTGENHHAVFTLKKPITNNGKPTQLRITLDQSFIHQVTLGRFRISATAQANPKASGLPSNVEALIAAGETEWSEADLLLIQDQFHAEAQELKNAQEEMSALKKKLPKFTTSMIMRERLPEHKRTTHRRHRGEFLQPRESVVPGVPSLLHDWPEGKPVNRLTFARWLFQRGNPLTSRVIMNRTWQAFFGKGIVTTLEDFGYQGATPSHQELLDWLAIEFEESGWDMKHMHRLIVHSATYKQTSKLTHDLLTKDPENQFLARGPRFRVDAEMIRDIALHAAGLLEHRIGGPSVFPPQPRSVTDLAYGGGGYNVSKGPDRYRRGLYTYWKRATPYASFMTFDAPNPERTCARRIRSNTPLQALTLLNDEVYIETAKELAKLLLESTEYNNRERIKEVWMRLIGKPPSQNAIERTLSYFESEIKHFKDSPDTALAVTGETKHSSQTNQFAAWILTCRALLNLDEVITKS